MAWFVVRKATESDIENLTDAAVRFCERHGITYEQESDAIREADNAVSRDNPRYDASRLRPLWRRIIRRVLGSPYARGISGGYVGYCAE